LPKVARISDISLEKLDQAGRERYVLASFYPCDRHIADVQRPRFLQRIFDEIRISGLTWDCDDADARLLPVGPVA
jgi:hypothetical protein